MNKGRWTIVTITLIIVMLLSGCFGKAEPTPSESLSPEPSAEIEPSFGRPIIETALDTKTSEEVITTFAQLGDDLPISRGLAAKMLALALMDKSSIDGLDREITFEDTKPSDWYDRYVNACVALGLMQGGGKRFGPDEPLTLGQAQALLDRADKTNKIKMVLENKSDAPISYALWNELYYQLLTNLAGNKSVSESFSIIREQIIVLATPGTNAQLPRYNMITDRGPRTYSGLNMENYVDKQIMVLSKDGEILSMLEILSQTPVLKRAYIVKSAEMGITVFCGGVMRTYGYGQKVDKPVTAKVCDIQIKSGMALAMTTYGETVTGIIKKTTAASIELAEYGNLAVASDLSVYDATGQTPKLKTLSSLVVGTNSAEFVVYNGEIICGIITKKPAADKIRVGINTTGFGGLLHKSVTVSGDKGLNIAYKGGKKQIPAGETFTLSDTENSDISQLGRVYISPASGGRIVIESIRRAYPDNKAPSYRGTIEVSTEPGGFAIVNELSMEEYLYSVIPSEMPTSFGLEAAKVQAICARSYAVNQFYGNRFHNYGANVDDSVTCQVYNNIPENETSIKAANETAGLALTYKGDVISANFFSTSCGVTANSGDVWAKGSLFPTTSPEYLRGKKIYEGNDFGDLSQEENAYTFLKSTDIKADDSAFAWFRWQVELSAEQLSQSVNAGIKARYQTVPSQIKTLQPDGVFRSRPIETIGDVLDIEFTRRSTQANLLEIKVIGTKATVKISGEYNIRTVLAPKDLTGSGPITIKRHDGSTVTDYSLLPSAFIAMDKITEGEILASITLFGGGNGHGVGMTQNGVKGLVDKGFDKEAILKHYYSGIDIGKVY